MDDPQVVSRDEWLAARRQLLAKEKEFTRQRDALNAERRRLPMTEIDKEYVFQGRDGKASLLDLFGDYGQLPAAGRKTGSSHRGAATVLIWAGFASTTDTAC